MASKTYFNIAGIFMLVFIITSFGEIFNLPMWLNKIAVLFFAIFVLLGYYQKKKENNIN